MSFDQRDMSNYDGKPIFLFELLYGNKTRYYCNVDRDITINGSTYIGSNFGHNGITQSGDAQSDSVTVDCPADIDIVKQWQGTPPTDQIFLTIREMHYGDTEADVGWIGTVSDVRRPTPATAQIVGQTLSMSFKRGGLRLSYTRSCPHFIYDVNCGVNPDSFAANLVVSAVGGDWLESPIISALPGGWFNGGFVKFERESGAWERYGIESSSGSRIVLMNAADRITTGMTVIAYPGCARISSVCKNKFNNDPRYGGFSGMPGRSPFDGNPVF